MIDVRKIVDQPRRDQLLQSHLGEPVYVHGAAADKEGKCFDLFRGAVRVRTDQDLRIIILPDPVSCPQTGHFDGISRVPDPVRFSAIWGMIILAL